MGHGVNMHKARMAVLSVFVWVFDLLQNMCRNPQNLQAFPKDSRIPLSCFFPVCLWLLPYLGNPIGLLVPALTLSVNVPAGSVQVWTGRTVSVFQLPTRSDGSRGKAVDACWFMASKAQLDTGYQF